LTLVGMEEIFLHVNWNAYGDDNQLALWLQSRET